MAYWILQRTIMINFYYGIGLGWGWAIPRQISGIDVSVALALANVATLVWFATAFSMSGHEDTMGRSLETRAPLLS